VRTAHPRVTQGQKVTKGQDLADVDPSANKLHFELRRKGKPMDPEPMIAITG
jgi:murein DD-endopeptidase MepM/ murein hydrolase activator NlpD